MKSTCENFSGRRTRGGPLLHQNMIVICNSYCYSNIVPSCLSDLGHVPVIVFSNSHCHSKIASTIVLVWFGYMPTVKMLWWSLPCGNRGCLLLFSMFLYVRPSNGFTLQCCVLQGMFDQLHGYSSNSQHRVFWSQHRDTFVCLPFEIFSLTRNLVDAAWAKTLL